MEKKIEATAKVSQTMSLFGGGGGGGVGSLNN